jgi:hypothetical protein
MNWNNPREVAAYRFGRKVGQVTLWILVIAAGVGVGWLIDQVVDPDCIVYRCVKIIHE